MWMFLDYFGNMKAKIEHQNYETKTKNCNFAQCYSVSNFISPMGKFLTSFFVGFLAMQPLGATGVSPTVPADNPAVETRSMLFAGGDGVSRFYRIPAIVTTPGGTLVAVADRRLDSNKDLPGRIDVVCRTSTDGGASWGETVTVARNDSTGGYGDPALGVSPDGDLVCVMTHGQGLWESEIGSHPRICVSRSDDEGKSWAAPVDITGSLYSQIEGQAPVKAVSAFATSGRILTDSKGNMWFVLIGRPHLKKWTELHCYACKSTDGGRSWVSIPVAVDKDADESKIAELSDGSLLMSIRNRRKGWRKFSLSKDGGKTWTKAALSTTLPDPACNGDIVALENGKLLHTICDSHSDRTAVSLFSSDDSGTTWKKLIEVCPVGSAYSAMTTMPDGRVGILVEEASSLGGFRIWFTRLNINNL